MALARESRYVPYFPIMRNYVNNMGTLDAPGIPGHIPHKHSWSDRLPALEAHPFKIPSYESKALTHIHSHVYNIHIYDHKCLTKSTINTKNEAPQHENLKSVFLAL